MLFRSIELSGDIPDEVFVIGGGEIFSQLLPYAGRIYVTLIKKEIEGDTFFPEIGEDEWEQISVQEFDGFDFMIYERAATIC